jgi:hypothetical protein
MIKESICLSCKKLELVRIPGLSVPIFFCSAFPEGVPGEISGDLYDHREPLGDETELWEFNDGEESSAKNILEIYEKLKEYQDKRNPNAKEEAQKSYAEKENPYKGMTRAQILEALAQEFGVRDVSSRPEPHISLSDEDPEEDEREDRRSARRARRETKREARKLYNAEIRGLWGKFFRESWQQYLEDRAFKKLPPEVQRDMIRRARKAEGRNFRDED